VRRKQFFFEKKNQKTFSFFGAYRSCPPRHPTEKSFWFFFSKKNCFLSVPLSNTQDYFVATADVAAAAATWRS